MKLPFSSLLMVLTAAIISSASAADDALVVADPRTVATTASAITSQPKRALRGLAVKNNKDDDNSMQILASSALLENDIVEEDDEQQDRALDGLRGEGERCQRNSQCASGLECRYRDIWGSGRKKCRSAPVRQNELDHMIYDKKEEETDRSLLENDIDDKEQKLVDPSFLEEEQGHRVLGSRGEGERCQRNGQCGKGLECRYRYSDILGSGRKKCRLAPSW